MNENKYLENKNDAMGENSFMKKLLKKRLNQKGLTLIELLAVIVILAIVAAIAIPAIGNVIENSRYDAVKADAANVMNAANLYFTQNSGATTVDVATLKSNGFLQSEGKVTAGTVTKATTGNTLETAALPFSGTKTIEFNAATMAGINHTNIKGSEVVTGVTVSGGTATLNTGS
ncbi:prepilin-type N-terminal cleavage/methylation domain-containing protein [Chryseomicrobium excrementi]